MPQTVRSEIASADFNGKAAVAPVPAVAASAPDDGPDAEGVRQYRLALAVEARRFRRYPPQAKEANMTGTVEVRIAVATGGMVPEAYVARSSGHDLLDASALEMMKRAVPRSAVPVSLRGRAFVVSLPVVFDLANE